MNTTRPHLATALELAAAGMPVLPLAVGKIPFGNCRTCAKNAAVFGRLAAVNHGPTTSEPKSQISSPSICAQRAACSGVRVFWRARIWSSSTLVAGESAAGGGGRSELRSSASGARKPEAKAGTSEVTKRRRAGKGLIRLAGSGEWGAGKQAG